MPNLPTGYFKMIIFVNSNVNSNVTKGTTPQNGPGTQFAGPSALIAVFRSSGYQWLFGTTATSLSLWGSPELYIDPNYWDPQALSIELWDSNPNWLMTSDGKSNISVPQFGFTLSNVSPFSNYYFGAYSATPTTTYPWTAAPNYPQAKPRSYSVIYPPTQPALIPTSGTIGLGSLSQPCAVWPLVTLTFNSSIITTSTVSPRIQIATFMQIACSGAAGTGAPFFTNDPDMILDTP